MQLGNEVRVDADAERVWAALADARRLVECVPGAELADVADGTWSGSFSVKVGPLSARYEAVATVLETDRVAGRARVRVSGRETGGAGTADVTVTATLAADGGASRLAVAGDVALSGRMAQFSDQVLSVVAGRLLDRFARCVEARLAGEPAGLEPAPPTEVAVEAPLAEAPAVEAPAVEVAVAEVPAAEVAAAEVAVAEVAAANAPAVEAPAVAVDVAAGGAPAAVPGTTGGSTDGEGPAWAPAAPAPGLPRRTAGRARRAAPAVGALLAVGWALARRRSR